MSSRDDQPIHPDFAQYVPEEIVSLRQLEVLYGALWESRNAKDRTLGGPYALFQTPAELTDFVARDETDDSRLLVLLHVDVTGPAPEVTDVSVRPLTADFVPFLGYSRYPWGKAIDHSLTQRGAKAGATAADVARYARECLLQWTDGLDSEPSIGDITEEHPDGWLIDALQFVGSEDGLYDRLGEVLEAQGQFAAEPRVVVSVAVRVDPDQLEITPPNQQGSYLPGELDVFNAAMRARKVEKLSSKHGSQSQGYGAEMVTGQRRELVGTADDPLGLYSTRQVDTFANLDRDTSWRSHPLGVESALLVQSATEYLEVCRWTRDGLHSYVLPYPATKSQEAVSFVSNVLDTLEDEGGHPVLALEEVASTTGSEIPDEVRFYRLIVDNDRGDISVHRELSDVDLDQLAPLVEAHYSQFNGWLFGDVGFATVDDWLLLSPTSEIEMLASLADGRYASTTLPVEKENNRRRIDNSVDELTDVLLTNETVNPSWLLSQYLKQLRQLREQDSDSRLPHYHVISQLSQLLALDTAGYLDWAPLTKSYSTETLRSSQPLEIHEHRVDSFGKHISRDGQSSLRRAFTFGVAVGQASELQRRHGRQLTLDDQYPAESFNVQSRDVVESYIRDIATAGDTLRRALLRETLRRPLSFTPSEFNRQPAAMRFYIAVGSTFGRRAYSRTTTLADD